MTCPPAEPCLDALEAEVRALRDALLAAEHAQREVISTAHPMHRRSAANLVHYWSCAITTSVTCRPS
jgi:hypothetical protein